eukprot:TRINITY_DN32_c0_g1_i1.p2 TRINITY_DN32_c0_g1~~TRINITY_DN32_c0_g1_i1.p2  ORF type:complete len:436 (-),score=148.43 TRINITY_DN32_c0_g1_i1:1634-2941(-)
MLKGKEKEKGEEKDTVDAKDLTPFVTPLVSSVIDRPRVLSIQSGVVYGYVGNKSAVFPLQLLGFEVDPINTCQFSNHTGYPIFKGQRTNADDFDALLDGLSSNGFLAHYNHLLTGYMSSVTLLQRVVALAKRLRKACPNLFFVCDPVMGDAGRLYVPDSFVSIYRDQLVPLADVITPNQTEAEFLVGTKIRSIEDGFKACCWFHERGVKVVVITSLLCDDKKLHVLATSTYPAPHSSSSSMSSLSHASSASVSSCSSCSSCSSSSLSSSSSIYTFSSSSSASSSASVVTVSSSSSLSSSFSSSSSSSSSSSLSSSSSSCSSSSSSVSSLSSPLAQPTSKLPDHFYHMAIPAIKGYFSGTGDLCTALILAWLRRSNFDLGLTLENVMAAIQAVICRTQKAQERELMLVQSRDDIDCPKITIHAERVAAADVSKVKT